MSIKSLKIIVLSIAMVNGAVWAAAAKNALIIAPMIEQITVNGNLSDWTEASQWAEFGKWWNGGLSSNSRAKYAWNDTADRLYIAIESTEGLGLQFEVGGLMGDLSNLSAKPGDSQATQFRFTYNTSTHVYDVANQFGQTAAGVTVAHVWNSPTLTIEVSLPIYSDWDNGGTPMNLAKNMSVYVYTNIFNSAVTIGDSQVANGTYIPLSQSIVKDVASQVLFGDLTVCGELGTQYLAADLNHDCYVTFADFGMLAEDWMKCTDPENPDNCE